MVAVFKGFKKTEVGGCCGSGIKNVYKSYLTLAAATAIVQGILFLISPLLTRLFTPEDFGGYGMILGVGSLLATVGTARLEHAIPIARGMAESIRLAILGLMFAFVTALVALLIITIGAFVDLWTGSSWAGLPLLLVPVLVVAIATFMIINALLLKCKDYKSVAQNKVIQGLSTGAFQLGLGLLGGGSLGLIAAQTLGYIAGFAKGLQRLTPRLILQVRRRSGHLAITLSAYRRYPLLMTPAALFNQATQQLPLLAIGYLYGLQEAGLYALVMRICGSPLNLIGQTVSQVYAAEFISHATAGSIHLVRHYIKLMAIMTLIGIPVVVFFVVGLKMGDQFLFGQDWGRLGDVALYLAVMIVIDFATTPVATTLGYLGRQHEQLLWDVGRLSGVITVFLYAYFTSMSYERLLLTHACVWCLFLLIHVGITCQACLRKGS
jgi:O-antigen/teichoic acid export membrane protein